MSLRDYEKPNDYFELGDGQCFHGFGFPCNVCRYVRQGAGMEPCVKCGHNVNAVMSNASPVKAGKGLG